MKTGLILIGSAFIIFVVLSLISRLHQEEPMEFEIDDLTDFHLKQWFWNDTGQLIYRIALVLSFGLFAAGVVVFSLNCFPEWGMTWYMVFMRLFAAFFGVIVAGYVLSIIANAFAFGLPLIGILIVCAPLAFFDWLRSIN